MRTVMLALVIALFASTASALEMENSRPEQRAIILRALPQVQQPQLGSVPQPRPPLQFEFAPGKSTHSDADMAPWDPSDQQQNQSHGLTPLPGDDAGHYYWR